MGIWKDKPEGNEHRTQPKHPLRKKPVPGWSHHPSPGAVPSCMPSLTDPHHGEQPHPSQPLPVPLLPYSSPEVKFGWIQVCLLCLGLSSCSLSSDIPCPALHWPRTCAAQRSGTAFIQGPHSASCSTPSPLLSVKDYQYIYNKNGPTLVCGDFLQNPGF